MNISNLWNFIESSFLWSFVSTIARDIAHNVMDFVESFIQQLPLKF